MGRKWQNDPGAGEDAPLRFGGAGKTAVTSGVNHETNTFTRVLAGTIDNHHGAPVLTRRGRRCAAINPAPSGQQEGESNCCQNSDPVPAT